MYDRVVVRLAPYKEKSFENTAHLLAYSFRPCLTEYYLYVDGNYFLCLCATFQFVVKKNPKSESIVLMISKCSIVWRLTALQKNKILTANWLCVTT